MKVHVKKALQKLFFFCPQRNNQKADRLCIEFSPTPNSSAQQVRPSSISNSIPPYSVTPSFPKNFITPRSGSTEQLTNTVMIITMVFQDEPQGSSSHISVEPFALCLSPKYLLIFFSNLYCPSWSEKVFKFVDSCSVYVLHHPLGKGQNLRFKL